MIEKEHGTWAHAIVYDLAEMVAFVFVIIAWVVNDLRLMIVGEQMITQN